MSRSFLDHITVTAFSLEAGAAFVSEALGVSPQIGGEHPRMATHNLLLRLGDTMFLEVIAPNPSVPAPLRPRWFALDSLSPQTLPSLSTWVVRSTNIRAAVVAASEPLGNVEPMSRGLLNWLITIPADGSVPLEGTAPALIEWHTDVHPAANLQDKGLSLVKLEIHHPNPDRVSHLLSSLELEAPVSVLTPATGASAHLVAYINTPQGLRVLSAPQPLDPGDAREAALFGSPTPSALGRPCSRLAALKPPFLTSWQRAWLGCGARTSGEQVHAELLARYSENHRAYHTLQHLGECLEQFAEAQTLAEHAAEVELALWFHDAIYDVRASDNEACSASWATSALAAAGGSEASVALVHALILATRHTSVPICTDEQVLVDIDLSILGAGPQRFAEYEAQIRQEYKHVPGLLFRRKRKAILRSFLERPNIFSTGYFRDRLESVARSNLRRSVGQAT